MNMLFGIIFIPIVLGIKQACPGGRYKCPDSATCCQLTDKSYGCCSLADAVCCADHIHCCPSKTICSAGDCIQKGANTTSNLKSHLIQATNPTKNVKSYSLLGTNVTSNLNPVQASNVVCPGGIFQCPDDTTCCEGLVPDTFGCCPLKDAVCCADKAHCCPTGTTCNLEKQSCNGDGFISQLYDSRKKLFLPHVPQMEQVFAVESNEVSSVVCPGSTFQCPNTYTCCKMQSGEWGCCPFEKATCCKDGLHCCPENMKCDKTSSHCSQGPNKMMSTRKIVAAPIPAINVVCPDGTQCRDDATCCQTFNKFGCCPYANATCCSDKLHCCPEGHICLDEEKLCLPKKDWLSNVI